MNYCQPNVKSFCAQSGEWMVPASVRIALPFPLLGLESWLSRLFDYEKLEAGIGEVTFSPDVELKEEGYRLTVSPTGVLVEYRDYPGAFYALQTLASCKIPDRNAYPCLKIADEPSLPIRGFMLDISRDKVPSVATVKALLDKMSSLKMNHLELYVEGFSFEYPAFPGVNEGETPMTLRDFQELEDYAALRAVDLCPNMNSFGHMTAWLKRKEYRSLAECPSGFFNYGFHFPASTLNPLDPRSLDLVKKMQKDLLHTAKSPYFNINCDEPFELGRGKSRQAVREKGLGNVYVDFVSQLIANVHEAGKTAMMWGDVLIRHPETLPRLPKNMIFLDWGYDYDYDFETHMKQLSDLGVRFIGCPGTSSWCSFASRKRDMLATVSRAVEGAVRFGGEGILLTDWGDFGHLQYLPYSFPGLIYAGLCAWEGKALPEARILPVLSQWVLPGDAASILSLSGYSALENQHVYNATMTFAPLMFSDPSPVHPIFLKRFVLQKTLKKYVMSEASARRILALAEEAEGQIDPASMRTEEAQWVEEEIRQTILFVRTGVYANLFLNRVSGFDRSSLKQSLLRGLDQLISVHPGLWGRRNKSGGLSRSLSRLLTLKSVVAHMN